MATGLRRLIRLAQILPEIHSIIIEKSNNKELLRLKIIVDGDTSRVEMALKGLRKILEKESKKKILVDILPLTSLKNHEELRNILNNGIIIYQKKTVKKRKILSYKLVVFPYPLRENILSVLTTSVNSITICSHAILIKPEHYNKLLDILLQMDIAYEDIVFLDIFLREDQLKKLTRNTL
ncbi:MAG: hypothetical protein ACTSX9_07350 [Candidatus Njordarchaeales archaeon]